MPGYISEVQYEGGASSDFIEFVFPGGTDTSAYSVVIYDTDGTVQSTMSLGAVDVTTAGNDGYLLDHTDTGFVDIRDNSAIALVDDTGSVVQFLGFKTAITATEGPANGQTSDTTGDITTSGQSVETTDGGATYQMQAAPNPGTIPCYAPGTMIDTPDGPRAVETLNIGDLVSTLDHGPQPIRWTRSGDQPLATARAAAKPVLIAAGALGGGRPAQDLIVSPQHRILVGGHRQLADLFVTEGLVPAKSLTMLRGIRHMNGKTNITWFHFACARDEVVTANGCLSESLLLGPVAVNGLPRAEARVVVEIFDAAPSDDTALNGPPARPCLTVGAVRRHIAQQERQPGQKVAREISKWDMDAAMERHDAEQNRKANPTNLTSLTRVA
jgi:Hint domain-containing protein